MSRCTLYGGNNLSSTVGQQLLHCIYRRVAYKPETHRNSPACSNTELHTHSVQGNPCKISIHQCD